ncbi:MAG: hypothetical protein ABW061_17895 [Polyangiaceae bacterium]
MNWNRKKTDTLAGLLAESAVLQAEMDAHGTRGKALLERGKSLGMRFAALPGVPKNDPRIKSLAASLFDLARGA